MKDSHQWDSESPVKVLLCEVVAEGTMPWLCSRDKLWFNISKLEINGEKTHCLTCSLSRAMPSEVAAVYSFSPQTLYSSSVCTRLSQTLYLLR